MTNSGSHLMTTLNPAHLSDGAGSYFVSGTKIKKWFLEFRLRLLLLPD
jgi:hypothetical protein